MLCIGGSAVTELPTAHNYEGFRSLLNGRRKELRMSMEELDSLAGFPDGYAAKLLTANYKKNNQQRNLGPDSFGKMLAGLGVVIALVPAARSTEFYEGTSTYPQLILARSGRLARAHQLTPARRSEIARNAALARWKK